MMWRGREEGREREMRRGREGREREMMWSGREVGESQLEGKEEKGTG